MATEANGETVLVTGGSGFVGGWVVVALLRRGYAVRTTVRSLAREAEVRAAVGAQVAAGDRLSVHAADLLADDGWARAAEGADHVVHVASPLPVGEFLGADLVAPARDGTLRVLRAGERAGVRRFVLTGSVVAAMPPAGRAGGPIDGPSERPIDETVWTDPSAEGLDEYARSKALAERAAWDFVRGHRGEATLTVILAGAVQGPVMGPDGGASAELIERLLSGRVPALPRFGFGIVDVRDLAELHVTALTDPAAAGQRLIAIGDFLWMADIARLLRDRFGSRAAKVPTRRLPDLVLRAAALFSREARLMVPRLGQRPAFTAAKAERLLGWRTRPAAESIVDCGQSLLDRGVV